MAQPTALDQMVAFFAVVHDPRRQHPTTLHTLETLLAMTLLATICGAQNWVEIEHWGKAKAVWLAELLDLPHEIPSHDTFGRVFAVLDPANLQAMGCQGAIARQIQAQGADYVLSVKENQPRWCRPVRVAPGPTSPLDHP